MNQTSPKNTEKKSEFITLVIQNSDPSYGNIFIGSIETIDLLAVRDRKINGFLGFSKDLCSKFPFEELQHSLLIPLDRSESSLLSGYLELCLRFVEKVQRKTNILVSCADAQSLSPVIMIAFLMKNFNYDFSRAYEAFSLNRPLLEKKDIAVILAKVFPNAFKEAIKTETKVLKDLTNTMVNSDRGPISENKDKAVVDMNFVTPRAKTAKGFTKVHSIESYRKNVEPELKFDDMNCIVQPNENNVGGIYLGNFAAAKNLQLLQSYNIFAVLTVAEELELPYKEKDAKIAHLQIMASDVENYDLSKHFHKCFEFIKKNQTSTNVLIHCYAGVSRSVTITIAYLMKCYGLQFKKALSLVREKRRQIYPNSGFIHQLRLLEKTLAWEQKKVHGILY